MSSVEGRKFEARDVSCIAEMMDELESIEGYELRGDPTWDDEDNMQFVIIQKPGVHFERPDFQGLANRLGGIYRGKVEIAVMELTEFVESNN